MENKRLMQHLLRDVSDLERIISEVKSSGIYDPVDMELIHTRTSGVRHMLEIAVSKQHTAPAAKAQASHCSEPPKSEPDEKVQFHKPEIKEQKPEEKRVHLYEEPEKKHFEGKLVSVKTEEKSEPREEPTPVALSADLEKQKPEMEKTAAPQPEITEHSSRVSIGFMQDTPLQKTETPPTPAASESEIKLEEKKENQPQTLGEKFTQNRSINDLLTDNDKNADYKFSKIPVGSLLSGIGINDRFLFTRELFEGDIDLYYDTLRKIDAMADINEAVVFMRENFKWNKNETSLKFIDLIKRRFL
ncbi:MAG: hypothetical protein FWG22_04530 [Prolixibacteraceae bacterium]|nr:hypothetical protein [Prolixibacteraceae bacterium]